MIFMIIVLDDNQYGVFYAVNDNWELQLLCVDHNNWKSCVEEFTYFTVIRVVTIVTLLIIMYTMIVIIVINSVHNNRVPESHYRPSLVNININKWYKRLLCCCFAKSTTCVRHSIGRIFENSNLCGIKFLWIKNVSSEKWRVIFCGSLKVQN